MLHSSSSHYYACYYALLCLLHHQQQALAATYVIDGATTNEWATKDEYQRLVDPARGPLAAAGGGIGGGGGGGAIPGVVGGRQHSHLKQQQQQHKQQATKLSDEGLNTDGNGDEQLQQQQQQSVDQILRSINSNNGNKNSDNFRFEAPTSPRVSQRVNGIQDDRLSQDELANEAAQRLVQTNAEDEASSSSSSSFSSSSSSPSSSPNYNQGNSFRNPAGAQQQLQPVSAPDLQSPAFLLNDRDELKQALDRLDLIERERKLQLKQMSQLDSLEKQAELGVAVALGHTNKALGRELAAATSGGARQLSELVAQSDSDLSDETEADSGPLKRETARHYCGDDLVQVIEMVCEHRVASTDSQPQIIDPVVKTKRSVDYLSSYADNGDRAATGRASYDSDETNGMPQVSRRRKLRTLQTRSNLYDGDGEPQQRASPRKAAGSPPSARLSAPLSLSSSSLSSSSSSLPVHDGTIGINNHNHNHNHQAKRYLSKPSHVDGNNNNNNNDNTSNNLNVMRMRQTRRVKSRRVRGITQECCVNACTSETLKQYCEAKP